MAPTDLAAALGPATKKPPAEPDGDGELDVVAQDLISAVKAGDAAGVASALRAAHEICQAGYEE